MKLLHIVTAIALATLLSGCDLVVMDPSGDIARQQADLIIYATVLMLIVIVPVIALTIFFAIKYRESNKDAEYDPDWDHSISLEIVIWAVPLAIIICLAGLTWVATHRLNPYDPIKRISADKPISEDVEPLLIQVVAMDWKWLFIYPEQGIATVNEFAAIVDRPIEFRISSTTVMNSFYVPALAGQIYAMSGMETELNAVINEPGKFDGFSANYSGAGFSQMYFDFHGLEEAEFAAWVARVGESAQVLDPQELQHLNEPSIAHPITYYGAMEGDLWRRIINRCVDDEALCLDDMMMVDSLGGGGLIGLTNPEIYQGICAVSDQFTFMDRVRLDQKMSTGQLPLAFLDVDDAQENIPTN